MSDEKLSKIRCIEHRCNTFIQAKRDEYLSGPYPYDEDTVQVVIDETNVPEVLWLIDELRAAWRRDKIHVESLGYYSKPSNWENSEEFPSAYTNMNCTDYRTLKIDFGVIGQFAGKRATEALKQASEVKG